MTTKTVQFAPAIHRHGESEYKCSPNVWISM